MWIKFIKRSIAIQIFQDPEGIENIKTFIIWVIHQLLTEPRCRWAI